MKIVFFGSPDFAVASLKKIIQSRHQVVGVITQPDRPKGRGMKLAANPVKILTLAEHLPLFQPEQVNMPETFHFLDKCQPDLLVVVAYGEFLGKKLLHYCGIPPINLHPSLLPDLRGAAPMNWALIKGYEKSGITTQFMSSKMDAGDILFQESISIAPTDTMVEFGQVCQEKGATLVVKTIDAIEDKSVQARSQDDSLATFAPLLDKKMGQVVWTSPKESIFNLWRGLYPWPGIFTFYEQKRVKLQTLKIPIENETPLTQGTPGQIFPFGDRLFVQTGNGFIEIIALQVEGKKTIMPREFCNSMKDSNMFCTQNTEAP